MTSDEAAHAPAPGWDAITKVFDTLYPAVEPKHVGYTPGLAFGSGLQGCSAYRAAGHWHYVTYGLTELWDKEADSEPSISGWGYEFTMRVPVPALDDETPPRWPFALLEQLAKTSNQHGTYYEAGHRIDVRQPVTGRPDTALTALAITNDPQLLEPVDSPNGSFTLLQVVGITAQELARMKATSTSAVLDELAEANPLLVTDPSRAPADTGLQS
ncbi:suppressor of fused domain protein [Actinospica robiniae]|uniref:suppressor of fused domain protein n=1 Tax=Actinospica robiniae TaxID=304901 RepID=UPI00041E6103|nr:suppressor of fused domain protein [Actinospica robiniae]